MSFLHGRDIDSCNNDITVKSDFGQIFLLTYVLFSLVVLQNDALHTRREYEAGKEEIRKKTDQ